MEDEEIKRDKATDSKYNSEDLVINCEVMSVDLSYIRATLCLLDIVLIFLIINIYAEKHWTVTEELSVCLGVSVDAAVSEVERVFPALRTGVVLVSHRAPLGYQGAGGAVKIGKWI